MAIRRFLFMSLAVAGAGFAASHSAMAQVPNPPVPAPLAIGATDGMIMDGAGIQLAPGETIIDGPPGLQAYGSSLGQSGAYGMGGTFQTLEPSAAMACANDCYMPCEPRYYGIAEALLMNRTNSGFTRSADFALDDFDWELGGRFTLGRRFDCVDGYELVYAGGFQWETQAAFGAGSTSLFTPVAPLTANNFLAFNPSNAGTLANPNQSSATIGAVQNLQAEYHSLEFNRTYTGWDVIRCITGLRTILYNEDYGYSAQANLLDPPAAPIVQNGLLTQSVDNFLIGPQLGLEMYYPLSKRMFVNSKLKGGIFLNIVDSQTRLFTSAGAGPFTAVAGGDSDDVEISGMFESSSQFGMHITSNLSVFAGYDIWFLLGVATSEDQLPLQFGRLQGNNVVISDDVFIHGVNAGFRYEF